MLSHGLCFQKSKPCESRVSLDLCYSECLQLSRDVGIIWKLLRNSVLGPLSAIASESAFRQDCQVIWASHIGKDPDAGKDRRQKQKRVAEDEMVG